MMAVHLISVKMLYLLWAIPVLLALYLYAAHRRRRALEEFADAGLLKQINLNVSSSRRRCKAAAVVTAFALIVVALTRPGWKAKPKQLHRQGRDVVFVLDVSRSMLAEDLKPSRLEHAKLAIRDCIDRLEGDRIGLIAFAGTAAVKCPLTLDYGFFRMILDGIDTDSVSRGGTMIGDAIRKALDETFDDREKRYKDIILITDGEDHDSFPVEAAEEAGRRGVRIIAIGLGDEEQGKRIRITDADGHQTFLKYKGQEVWTRLDADTLRKMVNVTPGGKYLNVAIGTMDLGIIYKKLVASAEKKQLEAKTVKRYEEKFQIFIALAFALLCLETAIGERKRRVLA
ncbi:MAG: VWA domain-containing protein [Planctomycetes bacterium]|nr:VWA domain-containing protein [Planctomycetota bacterium]